jgi:hypothetical protein
LEITKGDPIEEKAYELAITKPQFGDVPEDFNFYKTLLLQDPMGNINPHVTIHPSVFVAEANKKRTSVDAPLVVAPEPTSPLPIIERSPVLNENAEYLERMHDLGIFPDTFLDREFIKKADDQLESHSPRSISPALSYVTDIPAAPNSPKPASPALSNHSSDTVKAYSVTNRGRSPSPKHLSGPCPEQGTPSPPFPTPLPVTPTLPPPPPNSISLVQRSPSVIVVEPLPPVAPVQTVLPARPDSPMNHSPSSPSQEFVFPSIDNTSFENIQKQAKVFTLGARGYLPSGHMLSSL